MELQPGDQVTAPRALVLRTLGALGAGFAWFAWIDAPITDMAMGLFACAALAGFLAISIASLAAPGARRAQQLALLLNLVSLLLLLGSATLTLNLKGTGDDEATTSVHLHS
jgi:hypothetical protein